MAFIYVITNDVNGKQYIGKTDKTILERFKEHIKDSRKIQVQNRPLYRAIKKYGIEHFHITQLEECSSENAPDREVYWIEKLQTYKNGYNATRGGDGKPYHNYQKIAEKYLYFLNERQTADFFNCDIHTVKKACESCGINIIPAAIIQKREYGKKVAQCNKVNHNEVINIFDSLMSAATYMIQNNLTNCKHSTIRTHISEVCRNKRKSAAGFYWCFVE